MSRPTSPQIARPTVAIADQPQSFRWPSQKAETPSHCAGCGTRLLAGDIPTADHPLTDATCLYCGRVACELIADGWRRPLTAAEYAALPDRRLKFGKRGPLPKDGTLAARAVRLLGDGEPVPVPQLCEALSVSNRGLRQAIHQARKAGYGIVWTEGTYVMERGR